MTFAGLYARMYVEPEVAVLCQFYLLFDFTKIQNNALQDVRVHAELHKQINKYLYE